MAKETVVYISNEKLHVISGTFKRGNLNVDYSDRLELKNGTMLNGVIIDEAALISVLEELKNLSITHVKVVLNSSNLLLKSEIVPHMTHRELLRFTRDELSFMEATSQEIQYDYAWMNDHIDESNGSRILCCGAELKLIQSYLDIFEQVGIKIDAIDVSINAISKLTASMKELENKTYVISVLEGMNLTSILFYKNTYTFSKQTRLFSTPQQDSYLTEITNNISQLLQFLHTQYQDTKLDTIYFSGLKEEEIYGALQETLQVEIATFPEASNVIATSIDHKMHLQDYITCCGSLITRKNKNKKDINLVTAIQQELEESKWKPYATYAILPLALVLIFTTTFGYQFAKANSLANDLDDKKHELALLTKKINNKEDLLKIQDYQVLQQKTLDLKQIQKNIMSYPDIFSQAILQIEGLSGYSIDLQNVSYGRGDGTIIIHAQSAKVGDAAKYVGRLKQTGFFKDVVYTGYNLIETTKEQEETQGPDKEDKEATPVVSEEAYNMEITCFLKVVQL
ncbi:MAG: hypothetical protein RR524_02415 [Erysipelotrichaceae bacterium]